MRVGSARRRLAREHRVRRDHPSHQRARSDVQPLTAKLIVGAALAVGLAPAVVSADPSDSTSGIDTALFRSSYDTTGIFALDGARLMPKRDISLKVLLGYAQSPLDVAVPGVGNAAGDKSKDRVLDYALQLDIAFGMSLTDKLAIGFDVAGYRTAAGVGYGARGRYQNGAAGGVLVKSTGVIA